MSEVNSELIDKIKLIQPTANKKLKKNAIEQLPSFLKNYDPTEEDMYFLYNGDSDQKILGLCELAGKKNSTGAFKDSAKKIVKILHELMYSANHKNKYQEDFVIYEDAIMKIQLGEHYSNYERRDLPYANKILEIANVVKEKRPGLDIKEYIKKAYIDKITEGLKSYDGSQKENPTIRNNKEDDGISFEPKTWDDVLKLKNKKLLTTEFLSLNYNQSGKDKERDTLMFIDENKQLQDEIIDNFVDPLSFGLEKMNFFGFIFIPGNYLRKFCLIDIVGI